MVSTLMPAPPPIDLNDSEVLPAIPGMDPMAVYQLKEMLLPHLQDVASEFVKPMYPKSYRPKDYPKPEPGKALAVARRQEANYAATRRIIAEDLNRINPNLLVSGVFQDFDPDEEEQWQDNTITSEVELLTYMLADLTATYDAPARKRADEDVSAKKIDFTLACEEYAKRQHILAGNSPLSVDEARTLLITGLLCWGITLKTDIDDGEMPFEETLIDPSTCYPVFDGNRGMRSMTRSYHTTLGEAVGTYTSSDNDLEYLLTNRGKDGKFQQKRQEDETCEVIEYVDRRWRLVWFDESLVMTAEHKFGFVPYVYSVGGLGFPAFMRDSYLGSLRHQKGIKDISMVANVTRGMSLVRLLRFPVQQREAILSRALGNWQKANDPSMLIGRDDTAGTDPNPEISRRRKDVSSYNKDHYSIDYVQNQNDPSSFSPLYQTAQDNVARLTMPPSAYGANDKSNVSGYATNALNDSGRIHLVPWIRTLEEFRRAKAEMRLRLYRDWGLGITQGESTGLLSFPKADPGPDEDRYTDLDAIQLRTTGIEMSVSLANLPIGMLNAAASAVSIMMSIGILDPIGAMKMLNMPNPEKTFKRIQTNKILYDPDLLKAQAISELRKQNMSAEADYLDAAWQMQKSGPQGQSSPGAPPMGAPPSPAQGTPGLSLPAYNMGPGPGSGPAPGAAAPQTPEGF